jgi:hypothetical protein
MKTLELKDICGYQLSIRSALQCPIGLTLSGGFS